MSSRLESEIRARLDDYLLGNLSLAEFEDWFVPVLWEVDRRSDAPAADLAGEIHVLIAEFSRGDRSLEEFHDGLHRLVEYQLVEQEPPLIVTGTSTEITPEPALVFAQAGS